MRYFALTLILFNIIPVFEASTSVCTYMPTALVGLSTISYLKFSKNVAINLQRQHDNCLCRNEILVKSVKTASTYTKPL
jgi:hypothetical protein